MQHILACAQSNGRVNIFDLKIKKSIFSFNDGKEDEQRTVCVVWSQSSPTQLAVAFDHTSSGIQLWDLKQPKEAIKKIP